MTRNKSTQKGTAAAPQTDSGAMPSVFKTPAPQRREAIQKEIATLRKDMGLPANAAADARLAKADPQDFPPIMTQAAI